MKIFVYDEDDLTKDDLLAYTELNIKLQCKPGKETKFEKLPLAVMKRYKKQKKFSSITFTATYNKMS